MPLDKSENLVLVGLSGTGKSVVGKEIARLLGLEFIDTDSKIETRSGKSILRIFAEDGEPAFRSLEKRVLLEVCSGRGKVVATGGGAVIDPENRDLMLGWGIVFWLDARPETIYDRLMAQGGNSIADRPLLSGSDPLERIIALQDARHGYYSAAHHRVGTDDLSVEQTARDIVESFLTLNKETHPSPG